MNNKIFFILLLKMNSCKNNILKVITHANSIIELICMHNDVFSKVGTSITVYTHLL